MIRIKIYTIVAVVNCILITVATGQNATTEEDQVNIPGHTLEAATAVNSSILTVTSEGVFSFLIGETDIAETTMLDDYPGLVGLSFCGRVLFAATNENLLIYRSIDKQNVLWRTAGHANNVVAMTCEDDTLFVATSDDQLWKRPPTNNDVNWSFAGHTVDIRTMTACESTLWAIDNNDYLWNRSASANNTTWNLVGATNSVTQIVCVKNDLFSINLTNEVQILKAGFR